MARAGSVDARRCCCAHRRLIVSKYMLPQRGNALIVWLFFLILISQRQTSLTPGHWSCSPHTGQCPCGPVEERRCLAASYQPRHRGYDYYYRMRNTVWDDWDDAPAEPAPPAPTESEHTPAPTESTPVPVLSTMPVPVLRLSEHMEPTPAPTASEHKEPTPAPTESEPTESEHTEPTPSETSRRGRHKSCECLVILA